MNVFVQKHFTTLVILVLVVVLLLKECKPAGSPEGPTIIRDTTWVIKDSTVYSKPQVIKTIPVNIYHDSTVREYLPDTNYARLVVQYQNTITELLSKNIQLDSLKIDSTGWVKVTDTVSRNRVTGRGYTYNLKYPIIKETQILPAPLKRQFFVGGMVGGSKEQPVNQMNAGLLYKSKRDHILGVNAGFNQQGQLTYGLQSYWKIKLK